MKRDRDTERTLEAPSAQLAAKLSEAETLSERGRELERGGDPDGAVACYDRALALLAGEGRHPLTGQLLYHAGVVRTRLGRTTEAEALFHESLEVATWADDREGQAYAVNGLAIIAQRRGDFRLAESQYRRAARLASEARAYRLSGMVEQNLGVLANIHGDLDSALVHYRESRKAFEAADDVEGLSWVLNNLGMLETDLGQYTGAVAALGEAKALAQSTGDVVMEGLIELNRAEALIGLEKYPRATEAAERARTLANTRGDRLQTAEALKFLGTVARLEGDLTDATTMLNEGLALADEGEDQLLLAELIRELGNCAYDAEHWTAARAHWTTALDAFVALDAVLDAKALRMRLTALDDEMPSNRMPTPDLMALPAAATGTVTVELDR